MISPDTLVRIEYTVHDYTDGVDVVNVAVRRGNRIVFADASRRDCPPPAIMPMRNARWLLREAYRPFNLYRFVPVA
jgi:hypothetical protein